MSLSPAALLVIAIMIVGTGAALVTSGPVAVGIATISLVGTALALLSMFLSVLYKGVGTRRSILSICLVALTGVLAMPLNFAVLYRWIGIQVASTGGRVEDLLDAVYFSVVTWTTLGYGDILPLPGARWIVVVESMTGYVVMALLISALVAALSRKQL